MKATLLAILALAIPAFAQTTVKDALAKHWKTSGEFTLRWLRPCQPMAIHFESRPKR